MKKAIHLLIALALATGTPHAAMAHAHLVASTPAVGATVTAASDVTITYSEGIELGLSKFEIVGPDGTPARTQAELNAGDNKIVRIQAKTPFSPGEYTVHWHVISVDTHRTEGTFSFTVK